MSRGEILDAISGFKDENFEEIKKMYEEKVVDSIAFAKYFTEQGFKNIRAFDIGLCACITRWCYTAGYIDRDYTWAILEKMPVKHWKNTAPFQNSQNIIWQDASLNMFPILTYILILPKSYIKY